MVGNDGYVNLQLEQIKSKLSSLNPKCGGSIVITIDGPAGAGKTTLAEKITPEFNSVYTIHMDDLYEGWDSTLTPTLAMKLRDLLENLRDLAELKYSPYDWLTNSQSDQVSQPAPDVLILEGVGSGQGAIREFVSIALWIEVPVDEGLARVIKRDGEGVAKYMPAFLAAQEAHFAKEGSRERADYRLSGLGTV